MNKAQAQLSRRRIQDLQLVGLAVHHGVVNTCLALDGNFVNLIAVLITISHFCPAF
jgi:hypothetical protein